MLDSLLTQTASMEYASTADVSQRATYRVFEDGADADFDRILSDAEDRRRELAGQRAGDEADKAAERRRERDLESLKEKELRDDAREALEEAAAAADEAEKAYQFKAQRARGKTLAYSVMNADMSLPGGFKRQLKNSLITAGGLESGLSGLQLSGGQSAASILKDALESLNAADSLTTFDSSVIGSIEGILAASGVGSEEAGRLLEGLASVDGQVGMTDVLKVLSQAEDWLQVNGAGATQGQLTATTDGLNSLGQFLTGLGLSAETVKAVTSEMEIGAIIQVSTLQEICSGGDPQSLGLNIAEGDLNFLALALQSMGAGADAINGINTLLEGNQGNLSLGSLFEFLKTLEKPVAQVATSQMLADIKDVLSKAQTSAELQKEPVFNEIILKLSLLGDRELDKGFFELSPALQALRGGLSGIRADAEGHGGFNQNGGHNRQDRREEESRRLMSQAQAQPGNAQGVSGAFAGSVYDEVAGYSQSDTLAKQISQKLVYSARRGLRRLKMSLSPESLGSLSVELKVQGNKLTANIQAESAEAYKALEGEVMALREALAADGIELKLTLSWAGSDEGPKSFEDPFGEGGTGQVAAAGSQDGDSTEAWDSPGNSYGGSLLDAVV